MENTGEQRSRINNIQIKIKMGITRGKKHKFFLTQTKGIITKSILQNLYQKISQK